MLNYTDAHINQVLNGINQFYWPFIRIGGVMLVAPIVGDPAIPMRIKMGVCVALTLVLVPSLSPIDRIEPFSALGLLTIGIQLLIGIAIGLMVKLVFVAVTIAGESIATLMGLGYALINDPSNGVQVPIISQFYTVFVTLLFLAYDGHHLLIEILSVSFLYLPVGISINLGMIGVLLEWSAVLFSGAIQLALPAMTALLSINLIMGIMTRASPQLNLFSVGFPVTTTAGFLVILLSLPIVADSFRNLMFEGVDQVTAFMQAR